MCACLSALVELSGSSLKRMSLCIKVRTPRVLLHVLFILSSSSFGPKNEKFRPKSILETFLQWVLYISMLTSLWWSQEGLCRCYSQDSPPLRAQRTHSDPGELASSGDLESHARAFMRKVHLSPSSLLSLLLLV